jgi:hypothetical protein
MEIRRQDPETAIRDVRRSIKRLHTSIDVLKQKARPSHSDEELSGLYALPATLARLARNVPEADWPEVLRTAIGEAAEIEYRMK